MQKLPNIPNREKSSAFWVITGKYRASNRSLLGRSRSVIRIKRWNQVWFHKQHLCNKQEDCIDRVLQSL